MTKIIFVLIFLCFNLAQAQVACWKSELNYRTSKVYTSHKLYQSDLKSWLAFNKANPSPYSLSQAYIPYSSASLYL